MGQKPPTAGRPARSAAAPRNRGSDADSLGLFLRDLDHHPLPDHEAQTELAKRVAAGDDAGAPARWWRPTSGWWSTGPAATRTAASTSPTSSKRARSA